MNRKFLLLLITFFHCFLGAQHSPDFIDQVDVVPIHTQKAGTKQYYWLRVGSDMFFEEFLIV